MCSSVALKLVLSLLATSRTPAAVAVGIVSWSTILRTRSVGMSSIAAKALARLSMSRGAQGPLAMASLAP